MIQYSPRNGQKNCTNSLAFDGSPETQGFGKVRYWRDHVRIEGGLDKSR